MNKYFTYSVLQYKHSLILKEAVNVGIIFFFNDDKKTSFVYDDSSRVRSLYSNFDASLYNSTVKYISQKANKVYKTNVDFANAKYVSDFINSNLLPEDETVLQFSEPLTSIKISSDEQTVYDFSELLIPGL